MASPIACLITLSVISVVRSKWFDVSGEQHSYTISFQSPIKYQCIGTLLTKPNGQKMGTVLTSARCIKSMNWTDTMIGIGCTQLAHCPFQTNATDTIDSYLIHENIMKRIITSD
eukprot:664360_1